MVDYVNMWYEVRCPKCGTDNMVYYGDPSDCIGYDPEAVKCYKCGHIEKLAEDFYYDDEDEYDDLEPHVDLGLVSPRDYEKFEDLPIIFDDYETDGEWRRRVKRQGTIADLLKIWDIDDEYEDSEMAQVLRHLKRIMTNEGV